MSSTYLDLSLRANGREVFTTVEHPSSSEAARTLKNGQNNVSKTLGPSTTPAIEKSPISRTLTIAGGGTTIDLTAAAVLALPSSATRTADMTGKKLIAAVFRGDDDNAAVVNVAPGASNGYAMFGAGNDIDVKPGETIVKFFSAVASSCPAVAGGAKNIDIAGTNGDVLYFDLYFGT